MGRHAGCRDLLDAIAETARQSLTDFGGVATVAELAEAVLAAMPPPADSHGAGRTGPDRRGAAAAGPGPGPGAEPSRRGRGADHHPSPGRQDRPARLRSRACSTRRRRSAGAADQLVAQARSAGESLVPARSCHAAASGRWARASAGQAPSAGLSDGRLLRLAAALAAEAALSGQNELYHRDLPITDRARRSRSRGWAGRRPITVQEARDRVRARFPALPPLPDRPRLDQLIDDAGLGPGLRRRSARLPVADPRRRHHGPCLPAGHRHRVRGPATGQPAAGRGTGWPRARPPARSSPSALTRTRPTGPSSR